MSMATASPAIRISTMSVLQRCGSRRRGPSGHCTRVMARTVELVVLQKKVEGRRSTVEEKRTIPVKRVCRKLYQGPRGMCIAPTACHIGEGRSRRACRAGRTVTESPLTVSTVTPAGNPSPTARGRCQVEPVEKSMWFRICRVPNRPIDGIALGGFQIGGIVELGPQVASVFLAEGWAKPVLVRMARHLDASTPKRLLLVVDDDEATRLLLTELFNANGYAVVLAENGEQALKQLLDYAPDLVVLDLQMPVMDG